MTSAAPKDGQSERQFGNGAISLLPGLYAWQIYNWKIAVLVYVLALIPLAALSWAVVFDKISARWATRLRIIFIVVFLIALGLSAMEACDSQNNCHSVFWQKSPGT